MKPYKLRPFFKYAGGKWASVDKYPKPLSRTIIEPFAGSAGYATAHAERDVILVDADERICGAWDWLIKASAKDVLALPLLAKGESIDDLSIPQEAKWYLGYNINIGSAPHRTATRWDASHPMGLWTYKRRYAMARQIHRINHWKVHHGSYDSIDVEGTHFIDPPYQHKSFYREKVTDYSALAAWVESRKGQIIVCEGPGADWLPFKELCVVKTHSNAADNRVNELMYYRCQ